MSRLLTVACAATLLGISAGCTPAAWQPLTPAARGNGLEVRLLDSQEVDPGSVPIYPVDGHCRAFHLLARSTDGRRHDLRVADFRTSAAAAAAAIGRCPGDQLDPTWIGPSPVQVTVTTLASSDQTLWIHL